LSLSEATDLARCQSTLRDPALPVVPSPHADTRRHNHRRRASLRPLPSQILWLRCPDAIKRNQT